MRRERGLVMLGAVLALVFTQGAAAPPDLVRIRLGNLAFPSLFSIMLNVVKEQGLDRKNGLDIEIHPFSAPSAQLAAQATGETDGGPNGPLILQKMRLEGAKVQAVATLASLSALVVISRNPQVRTLADLKGKTLAADMGSAEFQVLATYAKSLGLNLQRDTTLIQAPPPLARTQLAAARVDAAMTWEPTATMTLRDSADYRVIYNGGTTWRDLTHDDGWELVVSMREESARLQPQAVERLIRAFQDGQRFIVSNPDEADRIVARTVGVPGGILKDAVQAGRIVFDVRPAWDSAVRDSFWKMFKAAVDQGYLRAMPDAAIVYAP
jgi:ABC-type nitrate/sulfonate/bicarbonate transport system substrate-binding protein